MAKISKRMQVAREAVPGEVGTLDVAVAAVLAQPSVTFDESVDVAVNLGVDPKHALQNSMMFTPAWPNAGPTGGAGLALPADTCSFMRAVISFAICPSF